MSTLIKIHVVVSTIAARCVAIFAYQLITDSTQNRISFAERVRHWQFKCYLEFFSQNNMFHIVILLYFFYKSLFLCRHRILLANLVSKTSNGRRASGHHKTYAQRNAILLCLRTIINYLIKFSCSDASAEGQ